MNEFEMRKQIEDYFDEGIPIKKMAELLDVTEHTIKINYLQKNLKQKS